MVSPTASYPEMDSTVYSPNEQIDLSHHDGFPFGQNPAVSPMDASLIQPLQLLMESQRRDALHCDIGEKQLRSRLFVSGLNAEEYASFENPYAGAWLDFKVLFVQKFPQELLDQIARMIPKFFAIISQFYLGMQSSCKMGILNYVGYAWVSVDTELFVWNYFGRLSELSYYDGAEHVIQAVEIVRVKPEARVTGKPSFLLCIATASNIMLSSITFLNPDTGERLKDISGRSFENWELHLPAKPLFLIPTDGVSILNLCCLRSGRLFYAGDDGSLYEVYYDSGALLGPRSWKQNMSDSFISVLVPRFLKAVLSSGKLEQITCDESRHILFTRNANDTINVYNLGEDGSKFDYVTSLYRRDIQSYASSFSTQIDVSALLPIVSITAIPVCVSNVLNLEAVSHAGVRLYFSCYERSSGKSQAPTTLNLAHIRFPPGWAMGSSISKPELIESSFNLCGQSFLMEKNPDCDALWCFNGCPFCYVPELIETTSVTVVNIRTSQEILLNLVASFGYASEEVHRFYKIHGVTQSNALCAALLCSSDTVDRQVLQQLVQLLILNRGEASFQLPQQQSASFGSLGNLAISGNALLPADLPLSACCHPFNAPNVSEIFFSNRHDAFYLHFARIARLCWNMPIAIVCRSGSSELVLLLAQSMGQSLLEDGHQERSGVVPGITNSQADRSLLAEARRLDTESVCALLPFAVLYKEVVGLLRLLIDHQFHVVVSVLPPAVKKRLLSTPLRDLMLADNGVFCSLINGLITLYLTDGASVRIITAKLRQVCPSLFTSADAVAARAAELLYKARCTPFIEQKEQFLNDALSLYEAVVERVNLKRVCAELLKFPCYEGVVRLVLAVSEKIDPEDKALSIERNDNLPASVVEKSEAKQLYNRRLGYYEIITNVLYKLISACSEKSDTGRDVLDPRSGSVFLERFILEQLKFENGKHSTLMQLLANFYEHKHRFAEAASVLVRLAELETNEFTLNDRLEFALRAKVCLQASNVSPLERNEILQKLTDQLDVLELQNSLAEMLERHARINPDIRDAIDQLRCKLFTTTELYEDIAERYNLPDCKLAICVCSSYYQQPLIEQLWIDIIEQECELSQSVGPEEQPVYLAASLVNVARRLTEFPRYLPLTVITLQLFQLASAHRFPTNWVPSTIEQMGLNLLEAIYCLSDCSKTMAIGGQDQLSQLYCFDVINSSVNLALVTLDDVLKARPADVADLANVLNYIDRALTGISNSNEARRLKSDVKKTLSLLGTLSTK
ncbi:Nucleoporin N and Nucleoporin C domain containing protein [Trichuris trichiura]|uniref:Nucleoporin N and Nucleoporin C domain containing protein n=1 Tax=Trichuris trichiura TaxID=36087 RepID=A0A077Z3P3_TRITR|nr:Nucleoporin N and Nucleoporin C domain containing protein [Trichuris trichiura]